MVTIVTVRSRPGPGRGNQAHGGPGRHCATVSRYGPGRLTVGGSSVTGGRPHRRGYAGAGHRLQLGNLGPGSFKFSTRESSSN
eukprot:305374-Hanusia_phi.AAC.1